MALVNLIHAVAQSGARLNLHLHLAGMGKILVIRKKLNGDFHDWSHFGITVLQRRKLLDARLQ